MTDFKCYGFLPSQKTKIVPVFFSQIPQENIESRYTCEESERVFVSHQFTCAPNKKSQQSQPEKASRQDVFDEAVGLI